MNPSSIMILIIMTAATIAIVLQWLSIIHYRTLCVKLTKTVNNMYCKHDSCTNLRYYTTPIEGNKGMLTNYCSEHLMERVENGQPH